MCMTDYIQERAQAIEMNAQAKIAVIDALLPHVLTATSHAESKERMSTLLILLLHIQAELIAEKATASRVIESTCEIRRNTQEVQL